MAGALTKNEIQSLCQLLDDDDQEIIKISKRKLLTEGEVILPIIIPLLSTGDSRYQENLKSVYQEIVGDIVTKAWRDYLGRSTGDPDLQEGALLISRFGYPLAPMIDSIDRINQLAAELDARIDLSEDPNDTIRTAMDFFCREKSFAGNREDFYNAANHFLNRIIDSRRGSPVALSVLFLLICRKLNIPVHGVALPGTFVVRFQFPATGAFIDIFNEGRVITREDIVQIFENHGQSFSEDLLKPATNGQILERMIRNLISVYEQDGNCQAIEYLRGMIDILNSRI